MAKKKEPKRSRPREVAPPGPAVPSTPWLAFVASIGLGLPLAALFHVHGVNGPWYWRWTYQPIDPTLFFAAAAAVAVALFWILGARLSAVKTVLALYVLHLVLALSFAALLPQGLSLIGERAADEGITSYHTEAVRIDDLAVFLREFPERLLGMVGHARTHPPGPILYYWLWNRLFGPETGAQWGGVSIVFLSGLLVPLAYLLARRLRGCHSGIAAAVASALFPGIIAMPGGLDPFYASLTAAMALAWLGAVEGRRRDAVGFGVVAFVALLFTHAFLVLGAFFGLAALLGLRWNPQVSLRSALQGLAIGAAVVLGLFGFSAIALGYDHLASLRSAMAVQDALETGYFRPWSSTVIWDLYDFALASGWGMVAVLICFLWSWRLRGFEDPFGRLRMFAAAGLATVLIVDLTGLLRAETARVWLFLQPFVIILAGCELSRWDSSRRNLYFLILLFAAVVLRTRMLF